MLSISGRAGKPHPAVLDSASLQAVPGAAPSPLHWPFLFTTRPPPARRVPAAKHTVADVRQRAEELAEAGRERAAEAGEAAREYTGAARDKVGAVGGWEGGKGG